MVVEAIKMAWKTAKTALEIKKVSEGSAAQVLELSRQVDQLVAEYGKSPSSQRLAAMKEEIGRINGKLEKLMVVHLSTVKADSADKLAKWFAKFELDLVAAEFAKQEYLRIAYEQSNGGLPQDSASPKQRWRAKRSAMLRLEPLYKAVANQMAGAALAKQREIEKSFDNQKAALQAIEEVRRQMPRDAADQFGMLNLDMLGFVDDIRTAIVMKLRYEAIGKWAAQKKGETADFVAVMDSIYSN